ncbi:MAG TPA: hypothetical protein VGE60_06755 [Telluria sp.]
MKTLTCSATIAATLLLGACTSTPAPAPEAAQPASATAPVAIAQNTMTGSRIPRKSTDRTLKAVGNQDYRDDNPVKSMGNEISRPVQ